MARIGEKRSRDYDVSELEEGKCVSVHGIPFEVSPAKESRKTKGVHYFEGKLTDGKRCARVVSFDISQLDALKKAEAEQSVVALENATVQRSSFSSDLEVLLNKRTKVTSSPRKLSLGDVVATSTCSSKTVKIADIVDVTVNQRIRVVGKVVKVSDVEVVERGDGKKLSKQDVVIGDETGSCKMVLWENDVGSFEAGKTYDVLDVTVRKYGASKYLSFSAQSAKKLGADITDVNDEDISGQDSEEGGRGVTGEISTVISTTEYACCKVCKSKVVSEDGIIAECSKCRAVMKVSFCGQSKSAKFIVTDAASGRETTLSAFEPILSRIVDGVDGSNLSIRLLMAASKSFRFNESSVVFSVQNAE